MFNFLCLMVENLRICNCGLSPRICRLKKHFENLLRGLGKLIHEKTWSRKSCGTVPLNFLLHVQNCTKRKPQINAVIPCQLETISHDRIYLKVPPPTHTHIWRKYILRVERVDFTCNTAEMFSFGPNQTRAKKAWSSSTCLLYAPDVRI